MFILKDKPVVYFDVDDTLVLWDYPKDKEAEALELRIGHSEDIPVYCLPHQRHINLLKNFKARGHSVVVWSQGGSVWALKVVRALGLEELVDAILPKPFWFVDDLPVNEFLEDEKRIWLDPFRNDKKVLEPINDNGKDTRN